MKACGTVGDGRAGGAEVARGWRGPLEGHQAGGGDAVVLRGLWTSLVICRGLRVALGTSLGAAAGWKTLCGVRGCSRAISGYGEAGGAMAGGGGMCS